MGNQNNTQNNINDITLYGTIGFTLLKNNKTKKKVLLFADMHDKLSGCDNKTKISDFFKSRMDSSNILLEEVARDNIKLGELWIDSEHTQDLKNLYLKNPKKIEPVDIRPFMIPFSWEVIKDEDNMKLKTYLNDINLFFTLKHNYLINTFPLYDIKKLKNTHIGEHYLKIKNKYKKFLKKNKRLLNDDIISLKNTNVLDNINNILSDIMEWYICANIYKNKKKSVIIHIGLAHSEKVLDWLLNHYKYELLNQKGINNMNNSYEYTNGCIQIDNKIINQF